MEPANATDVLLVSADLFLGSRIRGAAEGQGRSLVVAASGEAAAARLEAEKFRLVLIDLETPRLDIGQLVQQGIESGQPTFVAYGPHVRVPLLNAARQAGCDKVLTRGQFDASVREILSGSLEQDD